MPSGLCRRHSTTSACSSRRDKPRNLNAPLFLETCQARSGEPAAGPALPASADAFCSAAVRGACGRAGSGAPGGASAAALSSAAGAAGRGLGTATLPVYRPLYSAGTCEYGRQCACCAPAARRPAPCSSGAACAAAGSDSAAAAARSKHWPAVPGAPPSGWPYARHCMSCEPAPLRALSRPREARRRAARSASLRPLIGSTA